jgi:hypothetical protein
VLFERTLRPENRGVDISCRLTEAGEGWVNMFDRQNGASSAPQDWPLQVIIVLA